MMEKQCTGDCLKCSFQQQTYCSAQRSFAILKNQESIYAMLESLEKKLSGEEIIPLDAQEGRGAENSSPEENNN